MRPSDVIFGKRWERDIESSLTVAREMLKQPTQQNTAVMFDRGGCWEEASTTLCEQQE